MRSSESGDGGGRGKIVFDGRLSRHEAVAYFEAIVAALKSGAVQFRRGDQYLALDVGQLVDVEVKASRKNGRERVSFELEWRGHGPELALVED